MLHLGSGKGRHGTEVTSLAYRCHQCRLLLHLHSREVVIIRKVQKKNEAENRDCYTETRLQILPNTFLFSISNKDISHHLLQINAES